MEGTLSSFFNYIKDDGSRYRIKNCNDWIYRDDRLGFL